MKVVFRESLRKNQSAIVYIYTCIYIALRLHATRLKDHEPTGYTLKSALLLPVLYHMSLKAEAA